MAKNITLMGASYTDVPAVVLPQTGGGTARFDDASVTTATADDVAEGKIFLAADGTITTGTGTGGGGETIVVTDTTDVSGGIIRSIDGRVYNAETWVFTMTDDTTVTKVVDVYGD